MRHIVWWAPPEQGAGCDRESTDSDGSAAECDRDSVLTATRTLCWARQGHDAGSGQVSVLDATGQFLNATGIICMLGWRTKQRHKLGSTKDNGDQVDIT